MRLTKTMSLAEGEARRLPDARTLRWSVDRAMLVNLLLVSHLLRTSAMRLLEGSRHLPFRNGRIVLRSLAAVAMLGSASCGGGASAVPTSPGGSSGGAEILALDLSCPASLLIGEKGPCVAIARLRSGQTPVVSFDAAWGSTRPDLVGVDALVDPWFADVSSSVVCSGCRRPN